MRIPRSPLALAGGIFLVGPLNLLGSGCRDPVPGALPIDAAPDAAFTPADARTDESAAETAVVNDGSASTGAPAVYLSGGSLISVFRLDPRSGNLARQASYEVSHPGYMAWDPRHRFLYVLSRQTSVLAYAINRADGALTPINSVSTGAGTGPAHLSIHDSGKWALIAFFDSGHVAVNPLGKDGRIGAATDLQTAAAVSAHMAVLDPRGRFAFVPCVLPNYIAQYFFDVDAGRLVPNDPATVAPGMPGLGPRHLAFHPGGRFAYAINEPSGTLTAYDYDATSGRLTPIETLPTVPAGFIEHACAHVLVHPTGKFVYGSNREHGSIVIFSVDEKTGRLTLVGHEPAGTKLEWPEDFAIDPSGQFLVVGNQASPPSAMVFAINPDTGRLALRGSTTIEQKPGFVGVMALP